MSDKNDIDVLNTCLELLGQGSTIEACLERFPDAASELEPMLLIATQTQRVGEAIETPAEALLSLLHRVEDFSRHAASRRSCSGPSSEY